MKRDTRKGNIAIQILALIVLLLAYTWPFLLSFIVVGILSWILTGQFPWQDLMIGISVLYLIILGLILISATIRTIGQWMVRASEKLHGERRAFVSRSSRINHTIINYLAFSDKWFRLIGLRFVFISFSIFIVFFVAKIALFDGMALEVYKASENIKGEVVLIPIKGDEVVMTVVQFRRLKIFESIMSYVLGLCMISIIWMCLWAYYVTLRNHNKNSPLFKGKPVLKLRLFK